jgi:hypothetical protein
MTRFNFSFKNAPRKTLGNRVLDVRKDHIIFGLTLENRTSWKKHKNETRAKTKIGIKMMIPSALKYESVIYGSNHVMDIMRHIKIEREIVYMS